jgi:Holliday junction DNA helicase RuvA
VIGYLEGKLMYKSPEYSMIAVNGIGYQVLTPLSTFYELPRLNEPVKLHIATIFSVDNLQLYGFLTKGEKDVFLLLITVSRIGPKLALNILSRIRAEDLVQALIKGDRERLRVPGIGKKIIERMVLELKDKIAGISLTPPLVPEKASPVKQIESEVISALINLGYQKIIAEKALNEAKAELKEEDCTIEKLLKESLKRLSK